MEVADEVGLEQGCLGAGVVHILFSHVETLERRVESGHMEVECVVECHVGRESDGCIAAVDKDGVGILLFVDYLGEIADTVARQRKAPLPVEPFERPQGALKLDAHAVGAVYVGALRVACVGKLPGEHELVLIVHIVEVESEREEAMAEGVTGLVVEEAFGTRILVGTGVGEVVGGRLLVGNTPRGEGAVGAALEVHSGLGVEEIPVACEGQRSRGVDGVVPIVGVAVDGVMDVAVLHVGESRERARDVDGCAAVDIGVGLAADEIIVALVGVDRADVVAYPGYVAVVVAVEAVYCAPERGVYAPLTVVEAEGASAEAVGEIFVAHQVGFLNERAVGVEVWLQAVLNEAALRFELGVVAEILGVVKPDVEAQVVGDALIEQQLEMVLGVVVLLVGVEGGVSVVVGVEPAGIVSAAVALHILERGVVPRHVRLLLAAEGHKAHRGVGAAVSGLAEIAP